MNKIDMFASIDVILSFSLKKYIFAVWVVRIQLFFLLVFVKNRDRIKKKSITYVRIRNNENVIIWISMEYQIVSNSIYMFRVLAKVRESN